MERIAMARNVAPTECIIRNTIDKPTKRVLWATKLINLKRGPDEKIFKIKRWHSRNSRNSYPRPSVPAPVSTMPQCRPDTGPIHKRAGDGRCDEGGQFVNSVQESDHRHAHAF